VLFRDRVAGGGAARAAALRLRVDDPPRRRHAAFVGAAALAGAVRGVDALWVQRSKWEEAGAVPGQA
jgi:actin-related protein 2